MVDTLGVRIIGKIEKERKVGGRGSKYASYMCSKTTQ
jgi:hypothetical protein